MQNRNLILFLTLSMAMLIAWSTLVVPRLIPKKPTVAQNAKKDAAKPGAPGDDQAQRDANNAAGKSSDKSTKPGAIALASAKKGDDKKTDDKKAPAGEAKKGEEAAAKVAAYGRKTIVLGSSDPDTGYYLRAEATSRGGAISGMQFNDPRYRDLSDPKEPLKLVGNDVEQRVRKARADRVLAEQEQEMAAERLRSAEAAAKQGEPAADVEGARTALQAANEKLRLADRNVSLAQTTFNTDFAEIDALLPKDGPGISDRDWNVAEVTADPNHPGVNSGVTFEYPSPDGRFVVKKRYWLESVAGAEGSSKAAREVRDTDTVGYLLHLDIMMTNAGGAENSLTYTLQGPVGLPLEDAANARKLRDLKMGFLLPTGAINAQTKTATQILADEEKNKIEEWKSPIKYIGVDTQYFAALIVPIDDQLKDRTIDRSVPMVLETAADQSQKMQADPSVQLDSTKVTLAGKNSVTHHYELFAGPKRRTLLTALQAEAVLDFGWFGQISNVMLAVLNFFHRMGLSYGVAIICLTVLVRACMFPVSLRQTAQAQRMKDMQPKLAELKKKYADNKEKLALANIELMREYKVNPMAGCLPLLIQMPIFIALYQALQYSVDLRLAPFLYFNNLAGPDALFKLPFTVPWLGWTTFNLLPIIAVALMVVQQKMFMPPPTDEQQEMQQKMMSYMMVVMGAMFYKFPSGLCVYYISSSLWGFGERKLLTWWKPSPAAPPSAVAPADTDETPAAGRGKPARAGAPEAAGGVRGAANSFWQKLLDAADAANSDASTGSKSAITRRREPSGGKRNGKRSR